MVISNAVSSMRVDSQVIIFVSSAAKKKYETRNTDLLQECNVRNINVQEYDPTEFHYPYDTKDEFGNRIKLSERNVVVLLLSDSGSTTFPWQQVINDAKSIDRYCELLIIDLDGKLTGSEVLRSGYFAYFKPQYEVSVVIDYVEAAFDRIDRRKARFQSSNELNAANSLDYVVATLLKLAKQLTGAEKAQLVLLSKRDHFPTDKRHDKKKYSQFVRKFVAVDPPARRVPDTGILDLAQYEWALYRALYHDDLMLNILNNKIPRRVFPDVSPTSKAVLSGGVLHGLWDNELSVGVNSWIVLPLIDNDVPIGILTLDHSKADAFNYSLINENILYQYANQAALALRVAQQKDAADRLEAAQKKLFANLSLDATLKEIAVQAGKLAEALFCYVLLPDETNSNLVAKNAIWSRYDDSNVHQSFESYLHQHNFDKIDIKTPKKEVIDSGNYYSIVRDAFESGEVVLLDECIPTFIYVDANQKPDTTKYSLRTKKFDPKKRFPDYLPVTFDPQGNGQTVTPRSNIALPILDPADKQRVLGVINIEHELPCGFTTEIINTLKKFATLAAGAIKNSQETADVKALFAAERKPRDYDNQSAYFQELASTMQAAASATGGVKIFARWSNYTFRIDEIGGADDQTRGPIGHTQIVIKNQTHLYIRDIKQHNLAQNSYKGLSPSSPDYYKSIEVNPKTLVAGDKAVLCLPMNLLQGMGNYKTTVGAIWLHFKTEGNLSNEQIERLQLFADRAALMFHHFKERSLLSISEMISEKISTLHNSRSVTRTFDKLRDEIAFDIVKRLQELFDVDALFYIADTQKKELKLIAVTKRRTGDDFMELGKVIKYGDKIPDNEKGFAGNLYDSTTQSDAYWDNYDKNLNKRPGDNGDKRLRSLFGVRLQSPIDGEKVGVLVVNGSVSNLSSPNQWDPRIFDNDTKTDLIRFANLASALLAFGKFNYRPRPKWVTRARRISAVIAIIVFILVSVIAADPSGASPILVFISAFLSAIVAVASFPDIRGFFED